MVVVGRVVVVVVVVFFVVDVVVVVFVVDAVVTPLRVVVVVVVVVVLLGAVVVVVVTPLRVVVTVGLPADGVSAVVVAEGVVVLLGACTTVVVSCLSVSLVSLVSLVPSVPSAVTATAFSVVDLLVTVVEKDERVLTVCGTAMAFDGCGHVATTTAAHNKNRPIVMISRFFTFVCGSAMTVLSMSTVIHVGQNRAPSRRGAPQDGQVFIGDYPSVSRPYWNSILLISATVRW